MEKLICLKKPAVMAALAVCVTVLAACGGPEPQDVEIEVSLQDKKLSPETLQVGQDDNVTLRIQSDAEGSLHLHGYDIEKEVTPGEVAEFIFVADATGRYRLAFHPASGSAGENHHGGPGSAPDHHGSASSDTAAADSGSGGHHGGGSHAAVELDAPVSVSVAAEPDANGGVNVRITTQGWHWTSEKTGGEAAKEGGHAHIYVGDEKIAHVYEPRYYLEGLAPGVHRIRVTLNYDNHTDLTYNGKTIESTTTVTIENGRAGEGNRHSFGNSGDAPAEEEYDVGYLEVQPR